MRKFGISLLCLCSIFLSGQEIDSTSVEYKKLLAMKTSKPVVGISYELGAANNKVSYKAINDFSNKEFLSNEYKENVLLDVGDGLRFGYWQSINLSWDKPDYWVLGKYFSGQKFSIENNFITSASAVKDVIGLGLFGNKRYSDQIADLSNSEYESWWFTSLNFEKRFKKDSSYYSANFNLVIGHDYESYQVNTAKIYTEPNGEYIDAELDYTFNKTNNENSIPFRGIGITTGFSFRRALGSKFQIEAEIDDFGLMYWTNAEQVRVDSSFRFVGLQFDNIFELNDSIRDNETDRYSNGFYKEEKTRLAKFMPFLLNLKLQYNLKGSYLKQIYLATDYRYLPSYTLRFGLGSRWHFRKKDRLDLGFRYGGFNTIAVPLYYGVQLSKYRITIGSNNILAFGLPSSTTGASVFVGVNYSF